MENLKYLFYEKEYLFRASGVVLREEQFMLVGLHEERVGKCVKENVKENPSCSKDYAQCRDYT